MTRAIRVASRLTQIKPSVTLSVTAKAARLKAEGVDVIGFGAGEPDFDTPAHIRDAAKKALDSGATRYTEVAGTVALRKAICAEMQRAHGLAFEPSEVIVSIGAKHSLYNLFMAFLEEGDEVLIPAPYWVSYPEIVTLAGGRPVIIPTGEQGGFRVTPEMLRAHITPRTRAFILNSPSNPTGAGYDRAALEALRPILEDHDMIVVSDDIYRRLTYGSFRFVHPATLSDKLRQQTIVVDGFSKTYAMTGWRLGYTCGPRALIAAMGTLQGQSTSNATTFAQAAAVAALEGPQECVEEMRREFDRRRKVMVERLRAIPRVSCFDPEGAFYAFPDLSGYLGKRPKQGAPLESDLDIADYLLDVGRVAVVPGSGFGAPGFVRLSFATSLGAIEKGLTRMAEALGALID